MNGWPWWAVALVMTAEWGGLYLLYRVLSRRTPDLKCSDMDDEDGQERVTAPGECARRGRRGKR